VALPTYPFERQRYWIDVPKNHGAATVALPADQLSKKPDIADWFYLPVWKQAPLRVNKDTHDRWLIFDDGKFGLELANRLRKNGHSVVSISTGDAWSKLISDLDEPPTKILHCWSLARPDAQTGRELFSACQDLGFYSLLKLVKQIGNDERCGPIEIMVLSNDLQEVTGEESLCPEMSTLLAACKVVPQEYGEITCRSIDVICPPPGSWHEEKLITELYKEVTANVPDVTIAYRKGRRWVQQFDPLPLVSNGTTKLRDRGVYLITGGLGGVGLILARHLALSVRARVVLVGRSAVPASGVTEKLKELEAEGAEVLVLTANVADPIALRECFETAEKTFGKVDGVIHAAGVSATSAFKLIQEIEPQHCEMHFEPKVYGLYALEHVLAEREVDFCLVFSSLSSFLGGLSFSGYTAANIFVDAFIARHNQTNPKPWFGVNWDTWQTGKNQHQQLGADLAVLEMTPAEGAEAFERVVSQSPVAQLVHSTGDFQARLARWIYRTCDSAVVDASTHPRPNLQNDYFPAETELEETIVHIWENVLGIDKIGIHDNFFELGGTSLSGLQVINQIQKALGIQVSPADFLEVPTVHAVALKLSELPLAAETA